jgi:glycosyltransferase involved in cell wall biosynthesis
LRDFLHRRQDHVAWRGPISRDSLAGVLDRADVGIVPNRRDRATGQSSMKIFDYAARGLPIVSTRLTEAEMADPPPKTTFTDDPEQFAAAVRAAGDDTDRSARLEWARQRTWEIRWRSWITAVLGSEEAARE